MSFVRSTSKKRKVAGFTLVELLISLTLGLIITSALVRIYQSNNNLQRYNYALSNIQQDGRYIISLLRNSLMEVGRYNEFAANLDRSVDIEIEKAFIKDSPIVFPGDYLVDINVGSEDGAAAGPDTLVVNLMSEDSCTGSNFDFVEGDEFHTVNEYFLDNNSLKCRGHDGRYLRGLKGNGSSNQSVTLLENVFDFQVLYGISLPTGNVETGYVTSWVTADRVNAFDRPDGTSAVVAIKLAVLIKNDDEINFNNTRSLKMLGNNAFAQRNDGLYRVFETVILFRNSWSHLTVGG
ncbi:PilW family protein [Psychrosphaera aestuarii]|uniref:PilW family protein n=1 Tax=Psychrosphaera aestuarii TaxID=1266052 RepID=UPI001B31CE6C|nr:PilW family protein [Psychrosphaera aestuarii]